MNLAGGLCLNSAHDLIIVFWLSDMALFLAGLPDWAAQSVRIFGRGVRLVTPREEKFAENAVSGSGSRGRVPEIVTWQTSQYRLHAGRR